MKHQDHRGQVVEVGGLKVHLGGAQYRPLMDLSGYDFVVPFLELGREKYQLDAVLEQVKGLGRPVIRYYPIRDFSAPPKNWVKFLDVVNGWLHVDLKVIAFCMGGHGRTGTFLASLIAILEPEAEDPIAEARKRYCDRAVETRGQAEAVFALKGEPLPAKYDNLH